MNNKTNFLLLGLFSLLLGALSGVVLWAVLQVMNGGIALLWEVVPSYLDLGDSIFYPLLVCMVGGVLIGFIQKPCIRLWRPSKPKAATQANGSGC